MTNIIPDITITHGDCMDVMKDFPDKSFDLAIVDPPYFSGPERRQFYGRRISNIGVQRLYKQSKTWEVPTADYFDELQRVAQHYIVWGCNYYDYIFAHGRIIWDKCNGASSFSDCEIAATNLIESIRLFPFMWNGMLQGKSINDGRTMQGNKKLNEKRIHPTQTAGEPALPTSPQRSRSRHAPPCYLHPLRPPLLAIHPGRPPHQRV